MTAGVYCAYGWLNPYPKWKYLIDSIRPVMPGVSSVIFVAIT